MLLVFQTFPSCGVRARAPFVYILAWHTALYAFHGSLP